MDKNILKKFAIEQRKSLEEKVKNRLSIYYATEKDVDIKELGDTVNIKTDKGNNLVLSKLENEHRNRLKSRIEKIGINQVIEEASFTWFNRIIAIRYMELHDFLPLTKNNESLNIRVLSSSDGTTEPDIMKNQNLHNKELDLNIDFGSLDKIANINDKYEKVLLSVCYKLGTVLPQIFDGETDYIDLLIPKNLLNKDSFLDKLIKEVPEDNFNDIEIIGWFYQYYNQSEKDKAMKEKRAYKKTEIPYVTQIFTPDWIVKYMVENSLGRLWVEKNGDEEIIKEFKYFIKDNIEIDNKGIMPENITFIDPCMGSGHILVYAFEVFVKLYMQAGYNKKDIPEKILKNNLYGLDIDDRAGQFAIISIMLKAREYDKDIFNKIEFNKLNILSIQETDNYNDLLQCARSIREADVRETAEYLIETFKNAKEIGSLLIVEDRDYNKLAKYLDTATNTVMNMLLRNSLKDVIRVAKILSKKYDVVVTNPPYFNIEFMPGKLKVYLQKFYTNSKYDLFACFIAKNFNIINGYKAMITIESWMFLNSYLNFRKNLIDSVDIITMVHMPYLGKGGTSLGINFGNASFVIKYSKNEILGQYQLIRYFETDSLGVPKEFPTINERMSSKYMDFYKKIPGCPIVYWASDKCAELFNNKLLSNIAKITEGVKTGENNRFIRYWFEVVISETNIYINNYVSTIKYVKHTMGGDFRKWYGNGMEVLLYYKNGQELKKSKKSSLTSEENYFLEGISWTRISSRDASFRYVPTGYIPNMAGLMQYPTNNIEYILGLLNTIVTKYFLNIINPSINFPPGTISKLPYISSETKKDFVIKMVKKNIEISQIDWDSFETSWDFKKHPLVQI